MFATIHKDHCFMIWPTFEGRGMISELLRSSREKGEKFVTTPISELWQSTG